VAPEPAPEQIVTVFRSRLTADAGDEYDATADAMLEAARAMPGFVDFKTFAADDGERVSLVTFADRATHDAWRDDARHRRAQQAGRDRGR
jgi:heme-degrading monooxygenase HmoA